MGQKVHPYGFRLGFNKPWRSRWFAKQDYAKLLQEDLELKEALRERLKSAGVSSIEVDRPGNKLRVTIRTSRPGHHHRPQGRGDREAQAGPGARRPSAKSSSTFRKCTSRSWMRNWCRESIALQLEKRVAFRRAMRKAVDSALRFGCKGIKVRVSGRLNGAEIARSEWYLQGQLPLHTLRADIDYGFAEAHTTYGVIGVKAWLYKGEILDLTKRRGLLPEPEPRRDRATAATAAIAATAATADRDGDRGARPSDRRRCARRRRSKPTGPAVQTPPADLPRPAARPATPILPPLMSPQQPSWKQEARQEPGRATPRSRTAGREQKPEGRREPVRN